MLDISYPHPHDVFSLIAGVRCFRIDGIVVAGMAGCKRLCLCEDIKMNKFNLRGFLSISLALDFLVVLVSGIELFFMPHGRMAYWVNFTLLGINKTGWESLHLGSALLFVILTLFHLIAYNWDAFQRYFVRKKEKKVRFAEGMSACALVALAVVVSVAELPPVSTLSNAGERVKEGWIPKELKPPFPHAELMSIAELCDKCRIDCDEAISRLRSAGIKVKKPEQMIAMVARKNNVSARKLYLMMTGREE